MKQIPKQKWILSTLLVAALGSQYYFSTSSKNVGAFDLSSEAPNAQIQALVDVSAALQKVPPAGAAAPTVAAAASADATNAQLAKTDAALRGYLKVLVEAKTGKAATDEQVAALYKTLSESTAAPTAKPAASTEATTPAAPCVDCVVLTRAQAEIVRLGLLEKIKADTKAAEPVVAETAAEKRERLREEKKQKKIDDDLAKAEKLRDEKLARNNEFKDKMEEIAEKCDGQITCLTSRYSSLLSRYTGKKKIDNSVVQSAYRTHIEKVLTASLGDESKSEEVSEALASLAAGVPNDYRQVKENAINSVKASISEKAISANKNFRLSEQLSKAGKINESISIGQQAESDVRDATGMANVYGSTLTQSLKDVSDSVSMAYMNKNFNPDVQRLLNNMRLTTGSPLTTTDSTTTNPLVNPNQTTTRGVVRGGDANTNVGTNNTNTNNNGNALNGVQFGNTQTGGARGTRGAYPQ